jgi:Mrp family chromosome partitioning ATPase
LVLLVTLAALVGSAAVLIFSPREYAAASEILVSPLQRDDQTFIGLDLVRDSGEATRNVQTAAALIDSPEVAQASARRLGDGYDGPAILQAVEVTPKGESNVLEVSATADEPERAALVANTFATTALDLRVQRLQRQLKILIDELEARLRAEGTNDAAATAIAERVSQLDSLRVGREDPTLSMVRSAEPPTAAVGAPAWLILAGGLIGGLMLGVLAALGMQMVDRRISDQAELLSIYPIPLLTGVPHLSSRERKSATELPPEAFEAFRTLATQLQDYGTGRSILITSASSGDGKSTVAANLALALIEAGKRVVLVDLDVRKPELSQALSDASNGGGPDGRGVAWADGPIIASARDPRIRLLPAALGGSRESLMRRFSALLPEALQLADYVVIDSSPLGEVSDALPAASLVDDVLVVARLRHTDRSSLQVTRDLLQRSGVVARGLVLVGEALHHTSSSYYMRALGTRETPATPPTSRSTST